MSDPVPKEKMASSAQESSPRGLYDRLSNRRTMVALGIGSLLLLLVAAVGILYYFNKRASLDIQPAKPPSMSELAAQFPEISDLLLDEKLDSVYKEFLIAYQEGGAEAAYELAEKRGILNDANEVRITLLLDTTESEELRAGLEAAGIKVTAVGKNLMDIAIPVEVLEASLESDQPGQVFMDVSGLEHIRRLQLPSKGMQDEVLTNEVIESLPVINADVWHEAGITGEGVKIGILDVGFDKYQELLGSELPEQVIARSGIVGKEVDQMGDTHGTSVAEVIHDIAPDAELYLITYETIAEMIQSVQWLVDQEVDIISNSTGQLFGPNDGTGILAQMVDDVVSGGIVWVNSAGNYRWEHYRNEYQDENRNSWHEFYGDDEILTIYPSGDAYLTLFWNDWENPTQNFDLYIYDESGEIIASSINEQSGVHTTPVEEISYEFPSEGPYYMAIYAVNATLPVIFNFYLRHGGLEYYTENYSGNTPADARSSISAGAVNWSDDVAEKYSSMGPTEDGRLKPDICAPVNVFSVAFGEAFYGTSAAAPHVSGAAALVLQAYPDFTPQQVRDFLYGRAVDLGEEGPDYEYGNGRLWLGDPISTEGVAPSPTPLELGIAPVPAETATRELKAARATESKKKTVMSPTKTPKTAIMRKESTSFTVVLGLMVCVIFPGILGTGGIGLLALVWHRNRSHSGLMEAGTIAGMEGSSFSPVLRSPPPSGKSVGLFCPKCGTVNKSSAHFCLSCGYDFVVKKKRQEQSPAISVTVAPAFCSQCGQLLRKDSKFCPKCGNKIG